MRLLLSFFVVASLQLATAATTTTTGSSSGSSGCVKTKDFSGKQCRELKTRDQQETIGQVCVETMKRPSKFDSNYDESVIRTVFEVADPSSYTLESARVWIGTPQEAEDPIGSAPSVITKLASRKSGHQQQEERMDEASSVSAASESAIEIHYISDYTDNFHHTCPSCKDQELIIMATAKVLPVVVANDEADGEQQLEQEPITIYGFERDYSSLLSYLLGDYWTLDETESLESTPTNEDQFDGFPIHLTCKCHQKTATRRLADSFLRREQQQIRRRL